MKYSAKDPLNVIYCDNHLLVASKPSGMPTQTHREVELSAEEWAKEWVKKKFKKPGQVFLHAVHRLDKHVAGLVLFARTGKALSRLQKMMRERKIEKTYLAWVSGVPQEKEKLLEHYLVHGHHRALVSKPKDQGAKLATLHYRVLKKEKGRALLEVKLITGRYHQIRAQLAAIGHPILGDIKYGSTAPFQAGAIALWHSQLVFEHPVSKESVHVTLPLEDAVLKGKVL